MLLPDLHIESDGLAVNTFLYDLIDSLERTAAYEQDIRRVDLDQLLMRMLPSALRRHIGNRSFYDLKQRLLYAFS